MNFIQKRYSKYQGLKPPATNSSIDTEKTLKSKKAKIELKLKTITKSKSFSDLDKGSGFSLITFPNPRSIDSYMIISHKSGLYLVDKGKEVCSMEPRKGQSKSECKNMIKQNLFDRMFHIHQNYRFQFLFVN